ncbi:glycosyltransferase family 2 protein [Pendulispora albinea]|uniref:Glycosyltransferase family 2 protein n=1 Tax=Pendulispora albinea TaxID=2741071 RepID=A0ABZ2LU17_9BACT
MFADARVVVVVPAFEEEARIAQVLRTLPAWIDHVVVVDDASRDRTAEMAKAVADPRIIVLSHSENRGVGAAIVTGYRHALTLTHAARDVLVVMAGDGQMDPADLPVVVGPIARGDAGYVKGERFSAPDIRSVMPTGRRLGGLVFSFLTSLAIGVSIHDSQCGYTALARGACEALALDALWPRYGYPNDLLAQLAQRRIPIAEVPVRPIYAGEESKLRLWHLPRIVRIIARSAWKVRVEGAAAGAEAAGATR